jgi:hypothetical protein
LADKISVRERSMTRSGFVAVKFAIVDGADVELGPGHRRAPRIALAVPI